MSQSGFVTIGYIIIIVPAVLSILIYLFYKNTDN